MSEKSPQRRRHSRKRRPSEASAADEDADFDYEAQRPQKVPLLTAQEEAQRNLRLLADMRLDAKATEAADHPTPAADVAFEEITGAKKSAEHRVHRRGLDGSIDESSEQRSKKRSRGKSDSVSGNGLDDGTADDRSQREKNKVENSFDEFPGKESGARQINGDECVPSNDLDDASTDRQKSKKKQKQKDHVQSESGLANGHDNEENGQSQELNLDSKASAYRPNNAPSNAPSNAIGINRPETGGGQFAFAFDFGEGELDLDTEIIESADVDYAVAAADVDDVADYVDVDVTSKSRRPDTMAEFHPFCASTRPGLDFFAARHSPEEPEFLDAWRRERDFIKEDVVRTAKRAAAARKHGTAAKAKGGSGGAL